MREIMHLIPGYSEMTLAARAGDYLRHGGWKAIGALCLSAVVGTGAALNTWDRTNGMSAHVDLSQAATNSAVNLISLDPSRMYEFAVAKQDVATDVTNVGIGLQLKISLPFVKIQPSQDCSVNRELDGRATVRYKLPVKGGITLTGGKDGATDATVDLSKVVASSGFEKDANTTYRDFTVSGNQKNFGHADGLCKNVQDLAALISKTAHIDTPANLLQAGNDYVNNQLQVAALKSSKYCATTQGNSEKLAEFATQFATDLLKLSASDGQKIGNVTVIGTLPDPQEQLNDLTKPGANNSTFAYSISDASAALTQNPADIACTLQSTGFGGTNNGGAN